MMDEDSGVQAPVTRLRRRLSMEQSEEVNSPGPSTPTKKRGRLAAKPQLEQIVENAPESSSKRSTKKVPLKELVEAAEDKPLTPSRRSTRIKSNTSLVSESLNSPRAKRAARRTSQAGSDNESTVTPARQTRRIRKDSSSSIDKLETTLSTKSSNITQVIIEETNLNTQKLNDSSNDSENASLRKSPRLMGNKQKKTYDRQSIEATEEKTDSTINNDVNDLNIANSDSNSKGSAETPMVTNTEVDKPDQIPDDLSDTSLNMIKDLDKKPKNKSTNPNKSTSALDYPNSFKSKRHRSKSLNAVSQSEIKDSEFHSDNEITKNRIKRSEHSKQDTENHFGSGDNALFNHSKSLNSSKRKSISEKELNKSPRNHSMSISENDNKLPDVISPSKPLNSTSKESTEISPQGHKENLLEENCQDTIDSVTNFLGKPPSINLQSKIYFDDSDTDNKIETKNKLDSEDQCVPVVETRQCKISLDAGNLTPSKSDSNIKKAEINIENSSFLNRDKDIPRNDSCEPMDVDETLPNNITISEISQLNKSSDPFNQKSTFSSLQVDHSLNNSSNTMKNKSSNSLSASKNIETLSESLQLNKSSDSLNQKLIVSSPQFENSLNKSSKKSKRKTSTSLLSSEVTETASESVQVIESSDRLNHKSIVSLQVDNSLNKSSNTSKREKSLSISQNYESMSGNFLLNQTCEAEKQKSVETPLQVDNSLNKGSNKSKRKSLNSFSVSQNFEKSDTENKSTLILSHLKDTSSSENAVSKSPTLSHDVSSKSTKDKSKALLKEDISADYSTSTPLQQKRFQKLGLQINSSIIDTSNTECKNSEHSPKTSKKDRCATSKQPEQTSSTEEESEVEVESETEEESESEEESSRTKSNLLEDEVDVASDDYESGDSRDEEEKQYEADHEIKEKGEILDSEDEEVSYDSDYERDSFVVSSDEEDSDLLSGSGDDLSMSDNELTMSKKSKQKYNERKLKEQKKASKEMFEARHKLDKSAKKKSQKLESSDEPEDEDVAPMKKQRHGRFNSTNGESSDDALTNKSGSKKKSKQRLLSESDESVEKEQEISVLNKSAIQNDPLSMQVKVEPKTPMKDLNISTVQINENIEEVEVENDISYTKTNQTLDPLHTTAMEDTESSLSENSEIINNYDSILNQLNTENKNTTVKSHDISLNLGKKQKKAKEPFVDKLNLTHTKKLKGSVKAGTIDVVDAPQSLKKIQKKQKQNKISDEKDSSSNSNDLQLLFSEDSNDLVSEKASKIMENEHADDFIPLKRTPGKINILSGQDDEQDNNEFHIIIDTQGTREAESSNMSNNNSTKKRKSKKNQSANNTQEIAHDAENEDDDTPMEISFKSTKNEKFRKLSQGGDAELNRSINVGDISITGSAKKKKKHSLTPIEQADVNVIETQQLLDSAKKTKKRHTLDTNLTEDKHESVHNLSRESIKNQKNTPNNEGLITGELSNSKKRKRKSSANVVIENDEDEDDEQDNNEFHIIIDIQGTREAESSNMSNNNSTKKRKSKKNQSANNTQEIAHDAENEDDDTPMEIPFKSTKNEKFRKLSQGGDAELNRSINVGDISITGSAKKKKKHSLTPIEQADVNVIETQQLLDSAKKTKKRHTLDTNLTENKHESVHNLSRESIKNQKNTPNNEGLITGELSNSKKRKRKSSANVVIENDEDEDIGEVLNKSQSIDASLSTGRQKKKRKISETVTISENVNNKSEDKEVKIIKAPDNQRNKRNIGENSIDQINICESSQKTTPEGTQKKKNKKRKREDDDVNKASKVFKENSFDKVHISRLPASFLNQLEDKPKKSYLDVKKASVVSTTAFAVEATIKRKNKPSDFLEESVYLNESQDKKKQKSLMKKPKVLPFLPTAATSGSGFTTSFKISVLPQEIEFVAQTKNVTNFKNDYLYGKKIQRLGTYEMYKKHRKSKLSKF